MLEMKNKLYGINGKLNIAEEKTGDFEDMVMKTIQNETEFFFLKIISQVGVLLKVKSGETK